MAVEFLLAKQLEYLKNVYNKFKYDEWMRIIMIHLSDARVQREKKKKYAKMKLKKEEDVR